MLLAHDSGHACVVSTPVLELLPAEVPHSDGLLTENTAAAARALRRPYSLDELADAIADAAGECLRQGVTVCAEAGVGGGLIADDRLALGALKIFTDGGMMPRTAALSAPYAGLDHARQLYDDPAELTRQIVEGHRAGWQLAILPQALGAWEVPPSSATGPWTSLDALDALDQAGAGAGPSAARHRIEHAGLVRPDQLPRMAAAGVTAVVQPGFLWPSATTTPRSWAPSARRGCTGGRAFLDHGVRLAASSDRPVVDGAPLRAVQFMVERRSSGGAAIGPVVREGQPDPIQ